MDAMVGMEAVVVAMEFAKKVMSKVVVERML